MKHYQKRGEEDNVRETEEIYPIVDSLYGLKLFVTKRKTRLDFPTPVSPNKTT
jgi:hypothetical protein